jgi:hypothetical protein
MLRLKGCPRCHGDLCLDEDDDWSCLQCGNRLSGLTLARRRQPAQWLTRQSTMSASTPRPYAA